MIMRSRCSSRRCPSSALADFAIINNRVSSPVGAGSKRSNVVRRHHYNIYRPEGRTCLPLPVRQAGAEAHYIYAVMSPINLHYNELTGWECNDKH
jgi:hypothetical protein